MSNLVPVSICIPVKNEELNLPSCLESLSCAFEEIVVVDSGSTDKSVEIARAAGADVLHFQWNGKFPKKRNWTLQNHAFKHPWVLFLDADERLNEAFIEELRKVLPETRHSGFWVRFNNWFMGRCLRHGDVFRKLSLIKRGAGEYEQLPEDSWSHLDMEVHEHPVLNGTVGELKATLEHHDYRGLKNYLSRHNEYSSWEASRYLWLQKAANAAAWQLLTSRQQFKYKHLEKRWLPWVYWAAALFLKKGFLDGSAGWTIAAFKRRYFKEIRWKILELKEREGQP